MPRINNAHDDGTFLVAVLLVLAPMLVPAAQAQQAEIPPALSEFAGGDSTVGLAGTAESERIVDGKPRFYSLKRALHPVSWLEGGVRPLLRTVRKMGLDKVASEKGSPPVSGIKFGIKSLGSSSGFGPEIKPFHKNLFNRGIEVEVPLTVTYRLYESGRFKASLPLVSGGSADRLGVEVTARYASRPSEGFFGIGNDSNRSQESQFRSVTREAAVALVAHTAGVWSARLETEYRSVGITHPRKFNSALDVFQSEEIPGLTTDRGATMVSSTALIQRDSRDNPHLSSSGGLQRLEVTLNEGRTGGDFSYWRYRAQLQQFFPLGQERRSVVGFRASVETNREKGGSSIPFFDLPAIGSYSTVRGFMPRRFSDKSAISATAEYRYRIWRYFDWALFADAGQVAPEVRNFARDRFHLGYGMGFIVRSAGHRGIIMDVAHSREEPWMFYVDFSPLF